MRTRVIAIGNQKGGVGKTTNTAHIAAALGERGHKVLAWDLDPQAGLTKNLGVPPGAYTNTYHVLTGEREPEEVILTEDEPDIQLPTSVHLISSHREVENVAEVIGKRERFFIPHYILREPVQKLRGKYDYILLDTPPTTNIPTSKAAYISADYFIIVTVPEPLSLDGMKDALLDIRGAQRAELNPQLRLLGVLLCGFDRRIRKAREYEVMIETSFQAADQPSVKFQANIKRAAAIPRAQDAGQTLFQAEPNHSVVEEYRELTREIEQRCAEYEEQREVANG